VGRLWVGRQNDVGYLEGGTFHVVRFQNASLLLDRDLDDEAADFVETIRNSSDSLLTIVNEILDFSKIESGNGIGTPTIGSCEVRRGRGGFAERARPRSGWNYWLTFIRRRHAGLWAM